MESRPTGAFGERSRSWRAFLRVLLASVLLLVSACGSDSGEAAEAAPGTHAPATTAAAATVTAAATTIRVTESAQVETEEAMDEESGDGSVGGALAVSAPSTPADYGRKVIYRASIFVQAADVAAATREAVAIVQGLGGIVFGQQIRTQPEPRSDVTFKVLPEDFSVALERLAGIGELVDQQISADDVTERIVDFQSRIITAEASVSRLRKFLEEATDLENVALLERELLNRETDLETLRGQLRTLQDQVNLATITLTIAQLPDPPIVIPDTGMAVSAWVSTADEDPCLGDQDIVAGPESTVQFCLEVENTGEVALTDLRVRSATLRIRSDAPTPNTNTFVPVRGNFYRIEPDQVLLATLSQPIDDGRLAGRVATRGLEISFRVTGTPVDPKGAELADVMSSSQVHVSVREDDSISFPSAVRAGAGALVAVARFLGVVVGVLLPFLPVVALIGALVWWIRRRNRMRRSPHSPPR